MFDSHFKRKYIEDKSPQQNDYFESDNEPKSNPVQNSTFTAAETVKEIKFLLDKTSVQALIKNIRKMPFMLNH